MSLRVIAVSERELGGPGRGWEATQRAEGSQADDSCMFGLCIIKTYLKHPRTYLTYQVGVDY